MKRYQFVSTRIRNLIGITLFVILAGLVQKVLAANTTVYKVSQIAVAGATATYPQALNKSAKVVGFFTTASATEGFELSAGKYTTIKFPGNANFTRAVGINDSGLVVGDFFGSDNFYHGFKLSKGKYSQYDVNLGSVSTSIFGVNNNGDFTGIAGGQGYVNIGGVLTQFYASGTDVTYPYAINIHDQVVGQYFDAGNNSHGFYRDSSGTITEIAYPGALQTICFGLNDSGVITGWYQDSVGNSHGFNDTAGVFQTLDFIQTNGINNTGVFVGNYIGPGAPGGMVYGYLATPSVVKTPATVTVANAKSTSIIGISNSNVMVGFYTDSGGNSHGLMLKGSKVTNIDDPNAQTGTTLCQGINSSGQIVGYYTAASGMSQGFLYSGGTFTDIGPAGNGSFPENINDSGVIAGVYLDTSNVEHAFTYNGSSYTTIDVPGATFTFGWGINASGVLTLIWGDANGFAESSTYNGTTFTPINVPGALNTDAHSINKSGNVVFTWTDFYGNDHGAFLNKGSFYIFDDPNGTATRVDGLNDANMAVGRFLQSGSNTNFDGFKGVI